MYSPLLLLESNDFQVLIISNIMKLLLFLFLFAAIAFIPLPILAAKWPSSALSGLLSLPAIAFVLALIVWSVEALSYLCSGRGGFYAFMVTACMSFFLELCLLVREAACQLAWQSFLEFVAFVNCNPSLFMYLVKAMVFSIGSALTLVANYRWYIGQNGNDPDDLDNDRGVWPKQDSTL